MIRVSVRVRVRVGVRVMARCIQRSYMGLGLVVAWFGVS